jgi:hypothetical protein
MYSSDFKNWHHKIMEAPLFGVALLRWGLLLILPRQFLKSFEYIYKNITELKSGGKM